MRKQLSDIAWNVSEEEYRKDPAYSYSILAKFNREGFNSLAHLRDKIDTESLTFGSVVDTLITGDEYEFKDKFVCADLPNLNQPLAIIARKLFELYKSEYLTLEDISDNIIAKVAKDCNYYAHDRYKRYRVEQVRNNCSNLYKLLHIVDNKSIISNDTYSDALECARVLRNHGYTRAYFGDNNDPDTDRYFQLKFKGEYDNIPLRCMADVIIVNHRLKAIVPIDLKTSSKMEWDFHKSFIEWNYWIQAELYWYIIRQNMDKDEYFKDFKLYPYRFVVINRFNRKPLVWIYEDSEAEKTHYYGKNNEIECRNWRDIVKDLHYYDNHPSTYPKGIDIYNSLTEFLNK